VNNSIRGKYKINVPVAGTEIQKRASWTKIHQGDPVKSIFALIMLMTVAISANAAQTACIVTTKGNVPFQVSAEQPDREYATYEKAVSLGITFYLRAGHGVIRLEAWKAGQLFANSFVQEGNQPPYGDALTLAIQTSQGEAEAQCTGINAAINR